MSLLIFIRRIFSGNFYKEHRCFGLAFAVTSLYGVLGVLLSSAGCRPQEALAAKTDAVCHGNVMRQCSLLRAAVLNTVLECALGVDIASGRCHGDHHLLPASLACLEASDQDRGLKLSGRRLPLSCRC